ncbi:hypothetical protein PGIN_YH522_00708 [Porphyromonas gingivalis]|nr:hypothetical protein PGIN_YH522_00708 [Porphyromonas gingivalis]
MLSIPYLTAFVVFLPFRYWGKNTVFNSLEKVSRVSEKKDDLFLWKTLDLFPVGSKLPPFPNVLTVFLQMEAHDVLHQT